MISYHEVLLHSCTHILFLNIIVLLNIVVTLMWPAVFDRIVAIEPCQDATFFF